MNKPHILVADDDVVVRSLLDSVISSLGYQITIFETGSQCLEYLEYFDPAVDETPVLLFLDVQLEDMSGLDILTWVKESRSFSYLPVAILSATSEDELLREFPQSRQADTFLTKPFPLERISVIIHNMIGAGMVVETQRIA